MWLVGSQAITTVLDTGQGVLVLPLNDERVIDLTVTAFLCIQRDVGRDWTLWVCQIPSRNLCRCSRMGPGFAKLSLAFSCSGNDMNCSIYNARAVLIHIAPAHRYQRTWNANFLSPFLTMKKRRTRKTYKNGLNASRYCLWGDTLLIPMEAHFCASNFLFFFPPYLSFFVLISGLNSGYLCVGISFSHMRRISIHIGSTSNKNIPSPSMKQRVNTHTHTHTQ